MGKTLEKYIPYFSWLIALTATLGSLVFGEFLYHLPPCVLCWYQRILMYPLVVIIAVGIMKKDKYLPFYILPFSILGTFVATYHYLLQRGLIPESVAPCVSGISCTTVQVQYFGFITIPFLSFCAFVAITVLMLYHHKTK